ncbi:protease modulator HflC [bacterium]|nr:protease modulator HflC [bacterium]
MMYRYGPFAGFLGIALVILCYFSFFIVPEGKQAVVFQFERIIPPARTEAGLYFKFPWRSVQLFEKRIINWDGRPKEVTTKEKNNIIVDTTARFRISDPILLRRTFSDMSEVNGRLGKVIIGATNKVIAENDLVETVRNTNDIIERVKSASQQEQKSASPEDETLEQLEAQEALELIADEEISGDLEQIDRGREALTQDIIDQTRADLEKYGIELVDIQLKRVALEESVEKNVFTRMITERERIVAKIRSVGSGRREEIRGETAEELQTIQSEAYREVQQIKGEAEGKAVKIYADAIGKDEAFFDFYRSLEAYREGLREDSTVILSSDADFMKLLRSGPEKFFRSGN